MHGLTDEPTTPLAWCVLDCSETREETYDNKTHTYTFRIFHVMPVEDLKVHVDTPECWCCPRTGHPDEEEEEDDISGEVWVHNSFDRREVTYEKGWVH